MLSNQHSLRGFALLEALIAALLLALGLAAAMALQTQSQQALTTTQRQAEAARLVHSMAASLHAGQSAAWTQQYYADAVATALPAGQLQWQTLPANSNSAGADMQQITLQWQEGGALRHYRLAVQP